jgi:hypothetical protein
MPNVPDNSGRVVNSGISPMTRSSHHAISELACVSAGGTGTLTYDYSLLLSDYDEVTS